MNIPERIAIVLMVLSLFFALTIKDEVKGEEMPAVLVILKIGSYIGFLIGLLILATLFLFNKL